MFDFSKLDTTIHEKGRLAIMTLLFTHSRWSFQDLRKELRMSDGNLVTHLRTLHRAGYVAITKEVLVRPLTPYAITERGRKAFNEYIDALEELIKLGQK
jgi:DNA-binding HxlR family transcriptional regulator